MFLTIKRWLLILLFPLVISATPFQHAFGAAGEHSAGLGVGQVVLLGDWGSYYSNALGFNGMYDFESSELFGLLINLSYSSHSNTTDASSYLHILGLTPDIKVNFAYFDKLVIYGLAGLGLFHVEQAKRIEPENRLFEGSVFTIGFNAGAGFDLRVDDHYSFGTVFSFHHVLGKTDTDTMVGGTPGLEIGGTYMRLFLNFMYVF